MNLTKISEIKPLLERHGFNFSKTLGQNFLINKDIPSKIAEKACTDYNIPILEIGPGIGCLTKELALRSKHVTAVEIDRRLIPVLNETLSEFGNVNIINGDILKIDLNSIFGKYGQMSVCANLPYYITTPIIMKFLESDLPVKDITVMVQKEVAGRLCSSPGNKEYGAVTAAVQYRTVPKYLFSVSAGSFFPKPKVDSAVIKLTPLSRGCSKEIEKTMFLIIRSGFEHRRKKLLNSVSAAFGITKMQASDIFAEAGLKDDVRPEAVSVEGFISLAEAAVKNGLA